MRRFFAGIDKELRRETARDRDLQQRIEFLRWHRDADLEFRRLLLLGLLRSIHKRE